MNARYFIRLLFLNCSEIVETTTGNRIYLGTDCAEFAARMGLEIGKPT